jgi:hypothetical protein
MSSYSPFCVPFNPSTLRTPRKIRVVCIGAGLAGLTLAYKIYHELKLFDFVDFTIYERQVRLPSNPAFTATQTILTTFDVCRVMLVEPGWLTDILG